MSDEHEASLGLLLTYIDHKAGPLSNCVDPTEPDVALRTLRANQIEVAASALHAAGIVWGDIKAENVLIDGGDNAWIINFGGGYTRGWADEKIAGTVQGDVAGLAKLRVHFPRSGSASLVVRAAVMETCPVKVDRAIQPIQIQVRCCSLVLSLRNLSRHCYAVIQFYPTWIIVG